MTNRELELRRELSELKRSFSLCNYSDDNKAKKMRIIEIQNELGYVGCKPKKNRVPARVVNR